MTRAAAELEKERAIGRLRFFPEQIGLSALARGATAFELFERDGAADAAVLRYIAQIGEPHELGTSAMMVLLERDIDGIAERVLARMLLVEHPVEEMRDIDGAGHGMSAGRIGLEAAGRGQHDLVPEFLGRGIADIDIGRRPRHVPSIAPNRLGATMRNWRPAARLRPNPQGAQRR